MADAIVNNDLANLESVRQPTEAREMKRLYEALWGRTGTTNPIIPGIRASELPLCDYFMQITVEEIGERIKRIRNKKAAGPDGLLKEHLQIPGLPIIIAKVKENRTTLISKANKDGSKVQNWRPITISAILGRIFSSILDGRLRWRHSKY